MSGIKAEGRTSTVVVLTLDEASAQWLMGTMQNPLYGQHPDEEDKFSRETRIELFESIRVALS